VWREMAGFSIGKLSQSRPNSFENGFRFIQTATNAQNPPPGHFERNRDFGLTQSRVLVRRLAHVAGEDELAAHAPDATSDRDSQGARHNGLRSPVLCATTEIETHASVTIRYRIANFAPKV
jgi:hypothetical protein